MSEKKMSEKKMIHNCCFEYLTGGPYAVFTYAVADLTNDMEILFHLYAAFIRNDQDCESFRKIGGDRVVEHIDLRKEDCEEIGRMLSDERQVYICIRPREIYDGVDMTNFSGNGDPGFNRFAQSMYRVKDHMPGLFDENEIVFQIARYDSISYPELSESDITQEAMKKITDRASALMSREIENSKDPDHFKSRYGSLQKLIDNWLNGKLHIKDIDRFLDRADFTPAKDCDPLSYQRDIDMYSHDYEASIRETVYADEVSPDELDINRIYRISNFIENDEAPMDNLTYYLKDRHYLAKWVARKVKGQETEELEKKTRLVISGSAMHEYLRNCLEKDHYDLEFADIECYDPVNDIEAVFSKGVELPYEVLCRFRETGELFTFDEEMMKTNKKTHAAHALMGHREVGRVLVDYDPETYRVVSLDIRFKT